jgi:hypothetical protein
MKSSILIAGAAAFGLALASAAIAQPPADSSGSGPGPGGGRGAMRQACAADIQKFCPDAKPGPGGGMRECVVKNHDSFSPGCQAAIAQMRAARQQRQDNGGASPAPQ